MGSPRRRLRAVGDLFEEAMTPPGVRMWQGGRPENRLREASEMTIPVWESPSDYDRRKVALLDFAPTCEIDTCANRAARALQCQCCGAVLTWLCTPHADGVPEQMPRKNIRCNECLEEKMPDELLRVLSLARWF